MSSYSPICDLLVEGHMFSLGTYAHELAVCCDTVKTSELFMPACRYQTAWATDVTSFAYMV